MRRLQRTMAMWRVCVFLALCVVAAPSHPFSLEYAESIAHLTDIEAEQLTREGRIVSVDFSFSADTPLTLAPPLLSERLTQLFAYSTSNLSIEALFFTRLTDAERKALTPRRAYNIVRSISTLTGIEYYSASRSRYRIFYEDSYVVDAPASKVRQPDPLLSDDEPIPDTDTQYVHQRDSSFGANNYRALYGYQNDIITLELTNLTTMSYALIPLVPPEQLRTLFAIILTEQGVMLYGVSLTEVGSAGNVFGIKERVANSFTNRLIAISDWFVQQVTDGT